MIGEMIECLAQQLEAHQQYKSLRPEGITKLSFVGKNLENTKNKLIISLFGVERETAGGVVPVRSRGLENVVQRNPPLYLNLNLIFAAVYDEDRYIEALNVLDATLQFLQTHTSFKFGNVTYTLEIMSPNSQELNNIWSTMGGQYYPSVLCKLRRVCFDAEEIQKLEGRIQEVDVAM